MKNKVQPEAFPYEYRLILSQKYNQINKTWYTNLRLETFQEFTNFQYAITVDDKQQNDTLRLKITGLTTPKMLMGGSGPGVFEKEYFRLKGKYKIEIINIDKSKNVFELEFRKRTISVIKSPKNKFVDLFILK
ncbi:MAG: hypothetical protein KJ963_05880 [Bacteroidetes bacterium]|nr:hypothetical protein [Bacteroidota bacterium]